MSPTPRPTRPTPALQRTARATAAALLLAAATHATAVGTEIAGTADLIEFACTTCPYGPGELLSDQVVGSLQGGPGSSSLAQQHVHRYGPVDGAAYAATAALSGPQGLPGLTASAGTTFREPDSPFGGYESREWARHPDWPYEFDYNPALKYSAFVQATAVQAYDVAATGADPLDYRLSVSFAGSVLGGTGHWAAAQVWLYVGAYDPDGGGGGGSGEGLSATAETLGNGPIGFASSFVDGSMLGGGTVASPFALGFDIDFQLAPADRLFVVAELLAGSSIGADNVGGLVDVHKMTLSFSAGDTTLLSPVPEPHTAWMALAGIAGLGLWRRRQRR